MFICVKGRCPLATSQAICNGAKMVVKSFVDEVNALCAFTLGSKKYTQQDQCGSMFLNNIN